MELSFLDRDIDSNDVLPNDTPRTNVQMPNIIIDVSACYSRNHYPITHPTSELPIKPSLRPTAVPWAASVR